MTTLANRGNMTTTYKKKKKKAQLHEYDASQMIRNLNTQREQSPNKVTIPLNI